MEATEWILSGFLDLILEGGVGGGVETKGKEVHLLEMQFNFLLKSSINLNYI